MDWKPGDRLTHRFNPDLGPGLIESIDDRTVVVRFPRDDTVLRLATASDAIVPLVFRAGVRAVLLPGDETVTVEVELGEGRVRLTDGRDVAERDLWPLATGDSLVDRLAQGDVDRLDQLALRLDLLHLNGVREADGLGSFLGGRIRLFPHQLHAAERATRADPVRWLLADEVGLGKTVEACLILNHLICTGRADRTLVVTPPTLTVQWLGELWRKYHQVFVLLDEKRLVDVERDYGEGFNPFDAYGRVVVALDFLEERPWLVERAVESDIDLLIVDEAHHLRRPRGHPGNAAYRAIRPIAEQGRHVLLLTATPLEEDAHGFFRLLQLLRPDEFPEDAALEARLAGGEPLPPCTSATRRADIGGLPPREPSPVDLDEDAWKPLAALERATRAEAAGNAAERKTKLRRIRRALASGPALSAILSKRDAELQQTVRDAGADDPRMEWLSARAAQWRRRGDKTLVFVAQRETLELIRSALSRTQQLRVGVFHEDLSAGQRDIEVAQFRLSAGPSLLVSTECGGEGRNFEFCTRLVLYDLPWNPMVVEQRIGRLDRIGRRSPVEIVYFRPPSGLGAAIVRLYESLGLFESPLGGLERELTEVQNAIDELALSDSDDVEAPVFDRVVARARQAHDRIRKAALHELHRDPFRSEMGEAILARVPEELEELTQDVMLAAAEQLNLHVEEHRQGARHSIELGKRALIPSLPGMPVDASYLGSFDREEAVRDEGIDFFCTGHPLVEGVLAHLEESPLGRVALLQVRGAEDGFGLLGLFRRDAGFEAVAVDIEGDERPDWAERLTRRPLKSRRVRPEDWAGQPGWAALVRKLATHLERHGRPTALAAFRITGMGTDLFSQRDKPTCEK